MMRAFMREPLVHFLVLGALLFAIDAVRDESDEGAAGAGVSPRLDIVITPAVRARLAEGWHAQHGAAPSDVELGRMIDHWVRDEVLFREGTARGLDRDDEIVRGRVASKMGFVVDAQLAVAEPSDAELRAYFAANAAKWAKDERIDFTHVFVNGHDEAARKLAGEHVRALEGGADPNGMGDTFSGGRRYRGRKLDDLASTFGNSFVQGLDAQAIGTWAVRTSRFGVHAVRVDARTAGGAADFDAARLDVRHALLEERRKAAFDEAVDALIARYRVVRE